MRVLYSDREQVAARMSRYVHGCIEKDPNKLSERYIRLINKTGASIHQETAAEVYEQIGLQAAAGFPFRHIPGKNRGEKNYAGKGSYKVKADPFSATPADKDIPVEEISNDELTG